MALPMKAGCKTPATGEIENCNMNPATLSALSALAGSAIGALASVATTWLTQHQQDQTQRRIVGRRYTPLFDFFADTPNAFQVLAGDFVSTEDGTGVVHMAPGLRRGRPERVQRGRASRRSARWTSTVGTRPRSRRGSGQHVFDANPHVIRALKDRGVVVRHDSYNHSYPHCWRCDQPLVYRAISSWFVQGHRVPRPDG